MLVVAVSCGRNNYDDFENGLAEPNIEKSNDDINTSESIAKLTQIQNNETSKYDVVSFENYIGTWYDDFNPPNDLEIISKDNGKIECRLGIYRLTTFYLNITGGNEDFSFVDEYNLISGKIDFKDNSVMVIIEESNTEYIQSGANYLFAIKDETNQVDYSQIDNNKQDKKYQFFLDCINENPYDKWLKNELEKGERAEKTIYAEYLAFWKDELNFTIECGKSLFDDVDRYNQWKYNLEQWVLFSQETLKLEMNSFYATMPKLEVIIPHCKLIRQKVIDTKHFLYYLEFETTGNHHEIVINWSPIVETLKN